MPAVRRSEGALALIQKDVNGVRHYLVRWNRHWQSYALVGGHRQRGETFRDCLVREIAEELELADGREVTVATDPLAHREYRAWSARAQADTDYVVEVFAVDLSGATAHDAVAARPSVRWVTRAEVRAGQGADGAPVSETVERLLAGLDSRDAGTA